MLEAALVLAMGGILLVAFLYLQRLGASRAARLWGTGWTFLYAAGLSVTVAPESRQALALGHLLGPVFTAFLLAGVLAFVDRRVPRWVFAAGVGVGVVESAAVLAWGPVVSGYVAVPLETPFTLAAAVLAARHARKTGAGRAEHLLAPALLWITVANVGDGVTRSMGGFGPAVVFTWLVAALAVAVVQIAALLERARKREQGLLAERETHALELDGERRTLLSLVEAVPTGILLADRDGCVRLMNQVLLEHIGFGTDESWRGRLGREVFYALAERLDEKSRASLARVVEDIARDREHPIEPVDVQIVEPEPRTLALSAHAVRSPRGEWHGRVWMTRDVTEERKLSQRLQQAQRMETLGTLAGGVAHDFNNHLTSILGNASLALESLDDHHPLHEPLRDIERSAEHCGELTRGLLEFARQSRARIEAVDVAEAFRHVEGLLRPSLTPDVRLEVEVAPGVSPVLADRTQLGRVLTNLVVNARDAIETSGKGRIVLRARNAPGKPARVELVVEDDGEGMADDVRRRMFDPFFTTKDIGRGTGLGLAVVYGIVESHEGAIEVATEPGRGTCFRLLWPAATDPVAVAESRPPPTETAHHETLLLAEDEPAVRSLARRALERHGFRVLEAPDGEAAVEIFRAHADEIALGVFDLSMPRLNGLDALDRIHELDPGFHVVLMSGHLDREHAAADRPDGVRVLVKPFRPDALVRCVCEALDARKDFDPAPAGPGPG